MHQSPRRILVAAYVVQALAVLAWWLWLAFDATAAPRFAAGGTAMFLRGFLWADGVALVGGSLLAALASLRPDRRGVAVSWFVAGAAIYAALTTLGFFWIGLLTMLSAAAMAGLAAIAVVLATVRSRLEP